jgi:putative phage-type endonuclease
VEAERLMRVIPCEQNTPEWHAARCGRVTGSRIADVMIKLASGKPSAMRATYMGELLAERLSGTQTMDSYQSPAMRWGHENEAKACDAYAFLFNVEPVAVGFVLHPTLDMAGASPDRLVGDKGLIQIKCPNSSTHAETLLGAPIDKKYLQQMQWEMCCAEREFCDFVSFDPRFPLGMQLVRKRIMRDDATIKEMEREVTLFLGELSDKDGQLRKLYLKQEAA